MTASVTIARPLAQARMVRSKGRTEGEHKHPGHQEHLEAGRQDTRAHGLGGVGRRDGEQDPGCLSRAQGETSPAPPGGTSRGGQPFPVLDLFVGTGGLTRPRPRPPPFHVVGTEVGDQARGRVSGQA